MSEINPLATGAEGIAKAVGLKVHHVYNLVRGGRAPIQNVYGIGLVTDPVELKAWILGEHTKNKISEEKRPGIDVLAG